jgi:uncharacterized BrkB/YihY/UPF0761 family membrane protein
VVGFTVKLTHGGAALGLLRTAVVSAGSIALWWWTPFVLLSGRVRWRPLLPTALLTTLGTVVFGQVSARYVPHLLSSNERRYGTIGVAFSIESWLVALFAVVLAATVLGAVLTQSAGRVGAWARGAEDPDGWRRTPERRTRGARGAKEESSPADGGRADEAVSGESASA